MYIQPATCIPGNYSNIVEEKVELGIIDYRYRGLCIALHAYNLPS
jgi:hypothetical protein